MVASQLSANDDGGDDRLLYNTTQHYSLISNFIDNNRCPRKKIISKKRQTNQTVQIRKYVNVLLSLVLSGSISISGGCVNEDNSLNPDKLSVMGKIGA